MEAVRGVCLDHLQADQRGLASQAPLPDLSDLHRTPQIRLLPVPRLRSAIPRHRREHPGQRVHPDLRVRSDHRAIAPARGLQHA